MSPFYRTLEQLASLATCAATSPGRAVDGLAALVRQHLESTSTPARSSAARRPTATRNPQAPPPGRSAGGGCWWNRRLQDLPADLRWLYESGAVTSATRHDPPGLRVTSAADLDEPCANRKCVRSRPRCGRRGGGAARCRHCGRAFPHPAWRCRQRRGDDARTAAGGAGRRLEVPVGSLRRGRDMVSDIQSSRRPTSRPGRSTCSSTC